MSDSLGPELVADPDFASSTGWTTAGDPAPEYDAPGTHVDYVKTGEYPTQILRLEGNLTDAVVDRFSVREAP